MRLQLRADRRMVSLHLTPPGSIKLQGIGQKKCKATQCCENRARGALGARGAQSEPIIAPMRRGRARSVERRWGALGSPGSRWSAWVAWVAGRFGLNIDDSSSSSMNKSKNGTYQLPILLFKENLHQPFYSAAFSSPIYSPFSSPFFFISHHSESLYSPATTPSTSRFARFIYRSFLYPARKYARADPDTRYKLTCNFCDKVITLGVRRLKEHFVGGFRNVTKCTKCPPHVREEMIDYMKKKEDAKIQQVFTAPASQSRQEFEDLGYGEDEEDNIIGSSSTKQKRPRTKGALDMYFNPDPAKAVQAQKLSKEKQQTLNDAYKKDLRELVCSNWAKWFYDAGIPFNAAQYDSFKIAIESTGQFGPGMKPPSYHELRVPLLNKEVNAAKDILKDHREEWAISGCSIISDGWRDSVSQRDIINFLVNSPKGSVFIKSVDVSNIVKDANALLPMFEEIVDYVGEQNVIQIVTDNASNYKKAGLMLQVKKPNLFWTPCAAHCIDLMLEDVVKPVC
ncbi:uncharacterized protein LOC121756101 [Salvia splendens]|uniref:uncharacterized protein LOC121756101 n=1 Tax=Salvia splendens TaxID=180675 RepID=UPI001C25B680|nr:uncharacterized protein LOC121756101 [Salvia splendens]